MAAIYIIDADGGSLGIDAVISDSQSYSAKITQKPVEDGSSISDTKVVGNLKISLEGIVTNTPYVLAQDGNVTVTPDFSFLKNAGQFFNFLNLDNTENEKIKVQNVQANTPVLNAYKYLKNLFFGNKPFTLQISGYDDINNLLIRDFKVDFNAENGDCLHFNLGLEQIKIISSQTTTIPKSSDESKVSKKKNNGNEKPKEVPKSDKTGLLGGLEKLGSFLK